MLDRYFMMPPFIVSKSHLYVFKLGTVLVFSWTAITKVEIRGAIRRGYYIIMTVDGRKYFFGLGEHSMVQLLQRELLQRSPNLELS
ncbi:hypothetical protein LZQ00_11110 [Sphingobacterium sp. SRCM116780]|uniref:hypothetical protein n=1 Tax=Sphingobacterium sp. SRCM116780 TaxID=2907623 RepID=UPI001F455C3E|nr:hypothetical protein [Sphingobacterium sp. SRCM116780]UIR54826.1 hypothetical protein LZQ00_11110 [Sphingobacterium sp. SRCM116780]